MCISLLRVLGGSFDTSISHKAVLGISLLKLIFITYASSAQLLLLSRTFIINLAFMVSDCSIVVHRGGGLVEVKYDSQIQFRGPVAVYGLGGCCRQSVSTCI